MIVNSGFKFPLSVIQTVVVPLARYLPAANAWKILAIGVNSQLYSPMCCCRDLDWLSDAQAIEQKLKLHETVVDQVQAVLLWKNPFVMGIVLLLANALFWFVGRQDLSFLPTFFLLLMIKTILQLSLGEASFLRPYAAQLFPAVRKADVLPVNEVAALLARVGSWCKCTLPREAPSAASGIAGIAVLFALFVFFLLAGTFWVTFAVVNLALILPAILLHPKVRPQVEQFSRHFLH
jgi:chromate transport protein ChrA